MNLPKADEGILETANQMALTPALSRKRERGKRDRVAG
jgi:hypothetical protein